MVQKFLKRLTPFWELKEMKNKKVANRCADQQGNLRKYSIWILSQNLEKVNRKEKEYGN